MNKLKSWLINKLGGVEKTIEMPLKIEHYEKELRRIGACIEMSSDEVLYHTNTGKLEKRVKEKLSYCLAVEIQKYINVKNIFDGGNNTYIFNTNIYMRESD
ncbi:hypothetical protein [Clostridium sp. LP20]|uniref:hypothetical protein n=1 Tax=Clostridium sp. LP20 TaxID=3418665 RepID=UPI003EE46945